MTRANRSGTSFASLISALAVTSLVAVTASGCGLLKKNGDADASADDAAVAVVDAEAADAAPAPTVAPIAVNVNDVARFPDETALANVAATLQRPTNIREIPSVGKVVAALPKGAAVTEVAQRGTAILVVFDDPKDAQKRMGWVGADAFTTAPAVDAGAKPLTCTIPDVPLLSDVAFCGRTCAADTACPAGQACKGEAKMFQNGKAGDTVKVCTVFSAPASPTGTGLNKTLPTATPTLTAAPTVAPAGIKPDVVAAAGGKCDVGYTLVPKDLQCHKNCVPVVSTCTAGDKCQACAGKNLCGAPNFCK
ncbi:MAG: hypothetical protein JWP97_3028 [Labilithrix sp.]|nr:hypothetical protein [Labilithrix sp.]